jgi:hypothetical protein
MIYSAVNNWIEAKIAEFNQPLRQDEKLLRSTLSLDINSLPSGLKDRHFTLVLNSAERAAIEAEVFTVTAAIINCFIILIICFTLFMKKTR